MRHWIVRIGKRFPALVLFLLTLGFILFCDPYARLGESLISPLAHPVYTRNADEISEGSYHLEVDAETHQTAAVRFDLSGWKVGDRLSVEGRLKPSHVVVGDRGWKSTRIMLLQRNAAGKVIPGKHVVGQLDGTTLFPHGLKRGFDIREGAVKVSLELAHYGRSGSGDFSKLRVYRVKRSWVHSILKWFFVGVWGILGALYLVHYLFHQHRFKRLILINAILILIGTLMPSDFIRLITEKAESGVVQIEAKVAELRPPAPKPIAQNVVTKAIGSKTESAVVPVAIPVRKTAQPAAPKALDGLVDNVHSMGHFVLFATLCLLVYISALLDERTLRYSFQLAFDLFLFACVTEALQSFTPDRTPHLSDVLVDLGGVATAVVLFSVGRIIWRRGRRSIT